MSDNMTSYKLFDYDSPFEPSHPVKPEFFKGRDDVIRKILRYFNKILRGEVQHFFLTGNKGMGKTSIAEFIINEVKEYDTATIYISNKDNNSIETLSSRIIQEIINLYPHDTKKNKLKKMFGEHVSEISIIGNKIKFQLSDESKKDVKENFLEYINIAYEELKDKYKGLIIIIDDINGI